MQFAKKKFHYIGHRTARSQRALGRKTKRIGRKMARGRPILNEQQKQERINRAHGVLARLARGPVVAKGNGKLRTIGRFFASLARATRGSLRLADSRYARIKRAAGGRMGPKAHRIASRINDRTGRLYRRLAALARGPVYLNPGKRSVTPGSARPAVIEGLHKKILGGMRRGRRASQIDRLHRLMGRAYQKGVKYHRSEKQGLMSALDRLDAAFAMLGPKNERVRKMRRRLYGILRRHKGVHEDRGTKSGVHVLKSRVRNRLRSLPPDRPRGYFPRGFKGPDGRVSSKWPGAKHSAELAHQATTHADKLGRAVRPKKRKRAVPVTTEEGFARDKTSRIGRVSNALLRVARGSSLRYMEAHPKADRIARRIRRGGRLAPHSGGKVYKHRALTRRLLALSAFAYGRVKAKGNTLRNLVSHRKTGNRFNPADRRYLRKYGSTRSSGKKPEVRMRFLQRLRKLGQRVRKHGTFGSGSAPRRAAAEAARNVRRNTVYGAVRHGKPGAGWAKKLRGIIQGQRRQRNVSARGRIDQILHRAGLTTSALRSRSLGPDNPKSRKSFARARAGGWGKLGSRSYDRQLRVTKRAVNRLYGRGNRTSLSPYGRVGSIEREKIAKRIQSLRDRITPGSGRLSPHGKFAANPGERHRRVSKAFRNVLAKWRKKPGWGKGTVNDRFNTRVTAERRDRIATRIHGISGKLRSTAHDTVTGAPVGIGRKGLAAKRRGFSAAG